MEAKKESVSIETEKDEDEVLLPGFRFHPTDQELVEFYLRRKVEKRPIQIDLIKHVDVYKYEPWDLPKVANRVGDRELYFYCKRGRKYKNSIRPNRVTGSGFWKATGIDKPIPSLGEFHECIGLKKSLVYYRGSSGKGTKSDWMMHEFRLPTVTTTSTPHTTTYQEAEIWTLCRIFKREASFKKFIPDCRKFSSKKSFSDAISKTSYSESEIQDIYQTLELSGDKGTERKHVNQQFHGGNQVFTGQLSLTNQLPLMASLSFSCPNGEENLIGGKWDELRPMVEFAFDQSEVYNLR